MNTSTDSAIYVYCLVRSARRPRMTRAPKGVPEGAVPELHDASRGIWLVGSRVPLAIYGPSNLEPRLRDLDWVAGVAVAHEAVNEFFARSAGAVVVPTKLFTMFSSADKAVDDVRARRTAIDRVMRRIAGCEEWGIRITRRADVLEPHGVARASTGAGFLQARKAARDAAANARSAAAAAADASFERLSRHAKDVHRRARGREPGTNPPVLEAAFLVRSTARARFRAEAQRQAASLEKAGADLTLTGPWPAYNFVGGEA